MQLLADSFNIGEKFFGSSHPLANGELTGVSLVVSLVLKIAFAIAAISLLVFTVIAGISLIAGAGQSNPEKLEKGKSAIMSALIGFIVVLVAYWIVKLIEQITCLTGMLL